MIVTFTPVDAEARENIALPTAWAIEQTKAAIGLAEAIRQRDTTAIGSVSRRKLEIPVELHGGKPFPHRRRTLHA